MIKKVLTLIFAMVLGWQGLSFAAATQVDSLIEKLVEKGILDKKEARELKAEIASDAKAIEEDTIKVNTPDWIKTTKLKGDVRVRYQYERRKNDTEGRSRGRVRFRLGLEAQPNDLWKIGAGLASSESGSSGTDDARSTNMTFNDSFRRGDIRLDYAFAEYQAATWAKIIAGKYVKTDYLWTTSDMLWDTDINPAGGSIHLEHKFGELLTGYINSGTWVIDENGKTDAVDPFLYYAQGGLKYKQGNFDAQVATVLYRFSGLKGVSLDGNSATNTAITGTTLKYDYDSYGVSGEIGLNNPTNGALPIPRFAIFGDFVQNVDAGTDDNNTNSKVDEATGWAAGLKLGDEKVNGKGQWQWKYQYTNLGKDAFPDAFPDSDRLGGITDTKGHEAIFEYGLAKNVAVGFDYYQDQRIKAAKNVQKIIQADLNVKF